MNGEGKALTLTTVSVGTWTSVVTTGEYLKAASLPEQSARRKVLRANVMCAVSVDEQGPVDLFPVFDYREEILAPSCHCIDIQTIGSAC